MPTVDEQVQGHLAAARFQDLVALCETHSNQPGLLKWEVRGLLQLGRVAEAESRVRAALASPAGLEKDEFWKRHWTPLWWWARAASEPVAATSALEDLTHRWKNLSGIAACWYALSARLELLAQWRGRLKEFQAFGAVKVKGIHPLAPIRQVPVGIESVALTMDLGGLVTLGLQNA